MGAMRTNGGFGHRRGGRRSSMQRRRGGGARTRIVVMVHVIGVIATVVAAGAVGVASGDGR